MNIKQFSVALFWLELLTLLAALTAPQLFVDTTWKILAFLFSGWPGPALAYGLVVFSVSAIASLVRRLASKVAPNHRALWFDVFTCLVAVLILVSSAPPTSNASLKEIVTPYVSYALSLVLCAGTGYAAAEVIFFAFVFAINRASHD